MSRRARFNPGPFIAAVLLGAMAMATMGPGCGSNDEGDLQTIESGIPFDATPGSGYRLVDSESGEELALLTFDAVIEDSRCPTGVDCVWEGEATVRISLSSRDGAIQAETLTLPGMRQDALDLDEAPVAIHDRVRVHLLQLRPYPRSDEGMAEPEYRATFVALPVD